MMLFNELTKEDTQKISRYIDWYAGTDNGAHSAFLEHILRFWDAAKREYLYEMFDHQFIWEREITFKKNEENASTEIEDMMNREGSHFVQDYRKKVLNPLLDSISWSVAPEKDAENHHRRDMYYALENLMSSKALAKNVYEKEPIKIDSPADPAHPIALNKGTKVMRVLGKIAKAYGLEGYEEFCLAHSQVLSDKECTGTLCLSIHPLDYMTMSDNESNWESCMNWQNAGCYRQGTVEMMNSPMVVVGYLKAQKDMTLFDRYCNVKNDIDNTWNNKRWRCLFIVTPEIITSIMAYPYQHEEMTKACLEGLAYLAETNLGWTYDDEGMTFHSNEICVASVDNDQVIYGHYRTPDFIYHEKAYTAEELFYEYQEKEVPEDLKLASLRFSTNIMYNDFGRCDHYALINNDKFLNAYSVLGAPHPHHHLNYSGTSECMDCGEEGSFSDEGCLICTDCDGSVCCDNCGERVRNDEVYWVDGYRYCENCYNELFTSCIECQDDVRVEDSVEVFFVPQKVYDNIEQISREHWINYRNNWDFRRYVAHSVSLCESCANDIEYKSGYSFKAIRGYYDYVLPFTEEVIEKLSGTNTGSDLRYVMRWDDSRRYLTDFDYEEFCKIFKPFAS